ncbi:rod shape-determining protein [Streptomyces thermolineatus]|uniref:Rod shape-determining protein n=3 Tax=Streptomyces TaxID=1883 RepID=A0ABP5YST8_9ACTN
MTPPRPGEGAGGENLPFPRARSNGAPGAAQPARGDLAAGLAIDMGSARTRVWSRDGGLLADMPSTVLTGETAGRPVRRGRVVDVPGCARMLHRLVGDRAARRRHRPVIVLSCPVLSEQDYRAAAVRALSALGPSTVLVIDSARAAALGARADLADRRPLLVVDVGAGLVEVTLLADGQVARARQARLGLEDIGPALPVGRIVRAVTDMVLDMLREDGTASTVDALDRGPLVTGGGALRPEIVYRIATLLDTPARPAPAPATAVVRGAAAALLSGPGHPALVACDARDGTPQGLRR